MSYEQLNEISPRPEGSSVISRAWKEIKYDISVIIPCYNCEAYIKECLDSVVNADTEYQIQIIVVNDGSTDRTGEIICGYESYSNIKIITIDNSGVSVARNIGIEESEGRFLLFLDADDYLINNCIDVLLKAAIEKDADAVEAKRISENNNVTQEEIVKSTNALVQGYVTGIVFKRECFDNIKFPENYWYEDTIFTLRLVDNVKSSFIVSVPTYFYRKNAGSITVTSEGKPKTIDTFWITDQMLKDRVTLGLKNNDKIANIILSQIALNYIRTISLSENVRQNVFDSTCQMWNEYFSHVTTGNNLARSSLIMSLNSHIRETYDISCKLIWEEMLHKEKDMNVAISITENYIEYAYVMLSSLFENNKNRKINTYILYNNIDIEKMSLFEVLEEKYHQNIICQNIPDDIIPEELHTMQHWPKEVYFRCYLPMILPESEDRVLYIDTDTIINGSLDNLYDISFMNHSLVACKDYGVLKGNLTDKQNELFSGIADFNKDDYFNSGILLFNLDRIRTKITVEDIINTAIELNDKLFAPDQDLLNYIFHGDVYYEDYMKYNLFARLHFNEGYDYDRAKENAVIIHYTGRKPWTGAALRYNTERLWWEYASMLPEGILAKLQQNFILEEIDSNFANDAIKGLSNEKAELLDLLQKIRSKIS